MLNKAQYPADARRSGAGGGTVPAEVHIMDVKLQRRIETALSSGYEFVCCVDAATGRYEEYAAPGGLGPLQAVGSGEDILCRFRCR